MLLLLNFRKVSPMRTARYFVALTLVASLFVACGGGSAPEERAGGSATPATDGRQAATDKNAYPVFPNADSGADPVRSCRTGRPRVHG